MTRHQLGGNVYDVVASEQEDPGFKPDVEICASGLKAQLSETEISKRNQNPGWSHGSSTLSKVADSEPGHPVKGFWIEPLPQVMEFKYLGILFTSEVKMVMGFGR